MNTAIWPLSLSLIAFLGAALIIGVAGTLMTARAERLALITGLGQAIVGAVFIGAMTSLSGLVTSMTAAWEGHAGFAVSNALGGIAAQTAFLAVADIVYRRANLEHAAASEANLLQGVLLVVLLALPLLAMVVPGVTLGWVHPFSVLLVAAYLFGVHLVSRAHKAPMWVPRMTPETKREKLRGATKQRGELPRLWLSFLILAACVAISGWVIARAGLSVANHLGIDESLVGGVFTAVSTSLPELVIAVTAVRRGALTLAVGDILGGNAFDVVFIAASDALYRQGSIYAAISRSEVFWTALSMLLVGVLLTGLLRREKHGIGNIGFESFLVLVLYLGGVTLLAIG